MQVNYDAMQLFAVAQFRVADTRGLGRTGQALAFADSDLVIRVT
jgi:hypothetical protein